MPKTTRGPKPGQGAMVEGSTRDRVGYVHQQPPESPRGLLHFRHGPHPQAPSTEGAQSADTAAGAPDPRAPDARSRARRDHRDRTGAQAPRHPRSGCRVAVNILERLRALLTEAETDSDDIDPIDAI